MGPKRGVLRHALIGTLLASGACWSGSSSAQLVEFQVGDSATTNASTEYPCPYGNFNDDSKHQMIFKASELSAAGLVPGNIESVSFRVFSSTGVQLNNYSVELGSTSDSTFGFGFFPGLTSVSMVPFFIHQNGWNQHLFTTPFTWDGTSNIILQTCNNNQFNSFMNPQMVLDSTSFISTAYDVTNAGNLCNNPGFISGFSQQRPLVRFGMAPPVAAFSPTAISTCADSVQFTDLSTGSPTSWQWQFGDGNMSNDQHPTHTYASSGSYDITLIVTGALGSDTVTVPNAVTINAGGAVPVPASCTPMTTSSLSGIGITSVSYLNVVNSSGDGSSEGYLNVECRNDTALAGSTFSMNVTAGAAAQHNMRVWIDWDDDGSFSAAEMMLMADNTNNLNGTIQVPGSAVLNTPLRVRIMADYFLSPLPTPCGDPQYGQAEDYALVIIPNTQPPVAAFTAAPLVTCDGVVQFTDASQNVPTVWQWDFGDSNTSGLQNPQYTYTASGTYTVTLTVSNANGSDMQTVVDMITVDLSGALPNANCAPATTGYCCDFGIFDVQFVDIMNPSGDGSEGYMDFSCEHNTEITEGLTYPIFVETGPQSAQDVLVWIDLNNDGDLTSNEQVFNANNVFNASGNLTTPGGAVLNTPLRMRVSSDGVGNITASCDQPAFGQVEDYAVTIVPNTMPPVADFSVDVTTTCDGLVQFTDQSANVVQNWMWYFGDGNTSMMQNPQYTYGNTGQYTVSLVVSNAFGSDSIAFVDLVNVLEPTACDTQQVAPFPQQFTECFGILTDDGGPNGVYTPAGQGLVTIAPPNATQVTLTFSQFEFQPNDDYLLIYDGPDAASPLIGQFSGFGVGSLPNGGVITSSGGSISVQQQVAFGFNFFQGFIADWECNLVGVEEHELQNLSIWPVPVGDLLNIDWGRTNKSIERITVFNGLGEQVSSIGVENADRSTQINVDTWPPGPYLLILENSSRSWSQNFIVE